MEFTLLGSVKIRDNIMTNLYLIRNGNFPQARIEVSETCPQVISNSTVWSIDPEIFPLKDQGEMVTYFQELFDNPNHTKVLPGFTEVKYN